MCIGPIESQIRLNQPRSQDFLFKLQKIKEEIKFKSIVGQFTSNFVTVTFEGRKCARKGKQIQTQRSSLKLKFQLCQLEVGTHFKMLSDFLLNIETHNLIHKLLFHHYYTLRRTLNWNLHFSETPIVGSKNNNSLFLSPAFFSKFVCGVFFSRGDN